MKDAQQVVIAVDGEAPSTCTWAEFVEANEDDAADIGAAPDAGGQYVGGGGAAPVWEIEVVR